MKQHFIYLAIAATTLLSACSKDTTDNTSGAVPSVSGYVTEINNYGQPIPSFSVADMTEQGFEYADLLDVEIGDLTIHNMPYLTSFNEMAILTPAFVDYNAKGTDYGFGMSNGDFHYFIGGNKDDKVTITLAKKGGYKETYDLMKSIYSLDRQSGETAEEYANFRMITTTGVAPKVLYRSSNPLNCSSNPNRYAVVDSLAQTVGIKTEIDLADTDEKIKKYMATTGYASTYAPSLFNAGNTIACGMSSNTFCDDFKEKLGKAAKFMIEHEPPYLIHCNEGKDRCGAVSMIFEALAGATFEEMRRDYMVTLLNFYKIEDGGASYQMRQSLSIDRMLCFTFDEKAFANYSSLNWNGIDLANIDWASIGLDTDKLKTIDFKQAARNYLKGCGLTDAECDTLYKILTTGSK